MLHSSPIPTTNPIVAALASIRQEWQEAACGTSLLAMDGNVGLILADLINGLNLPPEVQAEILGADLFREMLDLLEAAPRQ
jgi:hypothetical protein